MSLVQFMAVGKSNAAAKLRPAERGIEKPPIDGAGETPAFDSTFAAVQRKRSAKPEAPQPQARKLEKPERRKSDQPPTDESDTSTTEAAPAGESTGAASADNTDHDKPKADSADGKPDAEKSPDGSEVTVSTGQPVQACQKVAATIPQKTSGAEGDGTVPASGPPADLLTDAKAREGSGKANPTPKPVVGRQSVPQTPGQGKGDADVESADADGGKEANEKLPPLPALAGKAGKSHEKSTHAAHVNAEPSDSATKDSAAVPQAPADGSLAQALASASEKAPAQLSNADGERAPTADSGLAQIDGHGKPGASDSTHAEVAPAAQDSPRTEGSETFDQVVLGLKGKLDARTGKAEIRLDPPNLGTVRVSVTLANGQLTAEFQSASNVVRDLLTSNLDKLKTALQGQGVTVDRLAVDAPPALPDAGGGQNPQASFGSATHDGRSAGQFQDGRPGQQRSAGEGFARMFTQAQEAPLDLVA